MYLGIDLGTTSLKVLLVSAKGELLDSASSSYQSFYPESHFSEQEPDDWIKAFLDNLVKIGEKHNLKNIKAISFCGQMHGLVMLDSKDSVIRPAILWNDNRSFAECDYLNNTIGKDRLISYTGNIAFTGFTAPKLLWVKRNEPQNFRKISKIMLPKDYLSYKITNIFASDVSDSSGTLYFDVKKRRWSREMLDILDINLNQLPKIYESYEIIGNVSEKFAAISGLSTNTKVVIGGGDQAVGAIGAGVVTNGDCNISLGTSGVMFVSSDSYVENKEGNIHSFCHANGKYHAMCVMLAAAGSLHWWSQNISQTNVEVLIDEAKTSMDDSIIYLPYISGERSPINDPLAKGMICGLTSSHKRNDITKAILNGVNLAFLDCKESMKFLNVDINSATVIGGGAKSDFWISTLSDVLKVDISTVNVTDGGCFGAAILAMVGNKEYKTVEEAVRKLVKIQNSYHFTDRDYTNQYKEFKKLYLQTKN